MPLLDGIYALEYCQKFQKLCENSSHTKFHHIGRSEPEEDWRRR